MTTKFERDKVYKTRDGRSHQRVIWTDAKPPDSLVVADELGRVSFRRPDGTYFGGPDFDLMLPKPEPIVWWGFISGDNEGCFHFAANEAAARAFVAQYPGYRLAKRVTTFED